MLYDNENKVSIQNECFSIAFLSSTKLITPGGFSINENYRVQFDFTLRFKSAKAFELLLIINDIGEVIGKENRYVWYGITLLN